MPKNISSIRNCVHLNQAERRTDDFRKVELLRDLCSDYNEQLVFIFLYVT